MKSFSPYFIYYILIYLSTLSFYHIDLKWMKLVNKDPGLAWETYQHFCKQISGEYKEGKLTRICCNPSVRSVLHHSFRMWKGKYWNTDNTKNGKRKGKLLTENKRSPEEKHTQMRENLFEIFQQLQMSFSIRRE